MTAMEQNEPSDSLGTVSRPDSWRCSGAIRGRGLRTDLTSLPPRERRDHRRHAAHVIMEIRGRVQGSQVTEIRGVTLDISSGGALAVFTDQVAPDPDITFMVRFVDGSGKLIAREFRWGTVLRSDPRRSEYVAAVKFHEPLPPTVLARLLDADLATTKLACA